MTGREKEIVDTGTMQKDPPLINSDMPIDRYAWLRDLTDDELWELYNKYNEHDDKPDDPADDVNDINDRIVNKDALIAEMERRGLFNKPDRRECHAN